MQSSAGKLSYLDAYTGWIAFFITHDLEDSLTKSPHLQLTDLPRL